MKATSRARDSRGVPSSHETRLSIDPDHHVTEAIGDMYGEYIDEDGRRQSFVLPPDSYSNTGASRNRHSSMISSSTAAASPALSSKDWGNGKPRSNERAPPSSPTLSIRSPSSSIGDTANKPFPLNDIDYESDPVAVAQEISNLQALRRMSMDVTSSADPDLPSFNTFVPSTPPEDGGDPGSVFWVPASLHPELAPKEFSAYLEAKKNEIRRPQRDGSLSPDGPGFGSPSLRRKKSMLSRQIDRSEGVRGYRDGAERLGRRESDREGPSVQLEDLMSDPSSLMRKLSVERRNEEGGDMPILNAAPGGAALRRSTRTTYRRASLRKGERVPYSKRAARSSETDAEDSSPASSPIVPRGGFRLERVSTEPIPLPAAHKDEPGDYSRRPSQRGSAAKAGGLSVSVGDLVKSSEKRKSVPAKQRRASSPKGSSRSRQSEPIPPVPVIVETPPPEQPQKLIIPERHSSFDPPPQLASQQVPQALKQAKPQRPALQRTQASEVVTEVVSSPTAPPNRGPEQPTPLLDPGKADGKERKRPDSAGSNDGSTGRKSSWGWLLGDSADRTKEKEKDHHHHHHHHHHHEKKDKEEKTKVKKEKRPKSADKHDNTRLDLLQKSIDLGNTGKVITSDTNGAKTDEKEARKSRSEDKKEKEGLFSFFGGSRKKSGSDGAQKAKGSSSRGVSPDPAQHQPQQTYYYTRFPIHIERAIYRLSHLKLANPRRPLQQQVLLSNFMYSYLAKVQQTQPHLVQQATISQPSREQLKQQQQQSEQQGGQYYQYDNGSNESDYVDDSQMYDDEAGDTDRPQSRAAQYTSKHPPEDGNGYYDQQPEPRREWERDRDRDGSKSSKSRSAKPASHEPRPTSDDMW
ncbi:unnamed protein product [Tuber aestivum]|uniref:Protein Zds1 C-terminal domain-containing protein n=1 Tax=Tuber aestivum TaxID=59557 RepID=A0A292PND6_9PEZI|nr:unnamed protein product [Tuber aestivum]